MIKKLLLKKMQTPSNKITIQLQIEQEIALYSKSILSVLL